MLTSRVRAMRDHQTRLADAQARASAREIVLHLAAALGGAGGSTAPESV